MAIVLSPLPTRHFLVFLHTTFYYSHCVSPISNARLTTECSLPLPPELYHICIALSRCPFTVTTRVGLLYTASAHPLCLITIHHIAADLASIQGPASAPLFETPHPTAPAVTPSPGRLLNVEPLRRSLIAHPIAYRPLFGESRQDFLWLIETKYLYNPSSTPLNTFISQITPLLMH